MNKAEVVNLGSACQFRVNKLHSIAREDHDMHHYKDHLKICHVDVNNFSVFSFKHNLKLPLHLRWQFSLDNSLNVGDNILGRLGGAVEVGDVALCDALGLLLHSILLFLLIEVPLEAPLAWIESGKQE